MKTLKKTLGVVLALAMVIGCVAMAFTAFAEDVTIVSIKSDVTSVKAGDTVPVKVVCEKDLLVQFASEWVLPAGVTIDNIQAASFSNQYAVVSTAEDDTQLGGLTGTNPNMVAGETVMFTADIHIPSDLGAAESFTIGLTVNDATDESGVTYSGTLVATSLVLPVAIPSTGIDMATTPVTILKGADNTVAGTITPANANDGATIKYTSSDESVATVDNTGKVTAVANGTATITATLSTDSSVTKSYEVTVKTKSTDFATDVKVADALTAGTDTDYALVLDGKFATQDIAAMFVNQTDVSDYTVEVTAADDTVVKVENGKISFVATGDATLTVTIKAFDGAAVNTLATKTVKVTVNPVLVSDTTVSALTASSTDLVVGDTATLGGLTIDPTVTNAADVASVKYTSSDESIVKVDPVTGEVTAVAKGTATITAEGLDAADNVLFTKTLDFTVTEAPAQTPGGSAGTGTGSTGTSTGTGTGTAAGSTNTGDAGVALAATLSLAAAAAFVFAKKKEN